MVRAQVHVPADRLAKLREIAAEEGVSVSELIRRGIEHVIRSRVTPSREELEQRAREVIGKFHSGLSDVSARHDDYFAEAVESSWRHS